MDIYIYIKWVKVKISFILFFSFSGPIHSSCDLVKVWSLFPKSARLERVELRLAVDACKPKPWRQSISPTLSKLLNLLLISRPLNPLIFSTTSFQNKEKSPSIQPLERSSRMTRRLPPPSARACSRRWCFHRSVPALRATMPILVPVLIPPMLGSQLWASLASFPTSIGW